MRLIDLTLILLGFSGVGYLAILWVALQRRIHRETRPHLLVALLVVSFGWVIIHTLYRLQALHLITGFDLYALERIGLYLLLASAALFYQLTRLFQRRPGRGLAGWLAGVLFLGAGLFLYENPLRWPSILLPMQGYVIVREGAAFAILALGWGVFNASALWLTLRSYRANTAPLHRNRSKYWSLAATLYAAGGGFILARLAAPGAVLLLLAVGLSLYVLRTYHLPDLRLAARRAATYALITLLTVALYTGGFYTIQRIFPDTPGAPSGGFSGPSPLALAALLAIALAVLFNPLLQQLERFISRWISGARYDAHQTLSEYSMSISNVLEIEMLATIAVGLISEAIEISHGALVIVRHEPEGSGPDLENTAEKYHLRSINGLGQEMPEGALNANNPVVYSLRSEHQPLTQYDIDLLPRYQAMEPEERAWLNSLKMDVYVPIYAKEHWIGLLALGPKSSGDRYFDEDLAFLQTLADQTAVALENARLYDDLKQRNAENERLNRELQTANEELARLDHAKSDFINIASHELRTPLTQVLGYNDILSEMIREGQVQQGPGLQMTDSVRKAARRLEEIVETMFDVSKLDTRTLDLACEPITLSSVLTTSINTWAKGMEERKQTVVMRGLVGLPNVLGDRKRLIQVFSHLIQNAIKSMPDGGQIRITGRVVEGEAQVSVPVGVNGNGNGGSASSEIAGEGNYRSAGTLLKRQAVQARAMVEVIIADSGIGIDPEDLERIFEKFYRVGSVLLHSTGDTKFKGAGPGLGLTIARGIVEAHGGQIWAESPGYNEETCPGAQFHVLLPVYSENSKNPTH